MGKFRENRTTGTTGGGGGAPDGLGGVPVVVGVHEEHLEVVSVRPAGDVAAVEVHHRLAAAVVPQQHKREAVGPLPDLDEGLFCEPLCELIDAA